MAPVEQCAPGQPGVDPKLLSTLIPLGSLMEAHQQELLGNSEVLYLCQGDSLFHIGQYDQTEFYLLSGEVRLEFSPDRHVYVTAGKAFAPIAQAQPRNCTAFASTDATLLKVNRLHLERLLGWSQAAEHLLVDLSIQRDLDEDAVWLDTVLRSNLFLKVPPTNVNNIIKHLVTRVVNAGEVIIRQGDLGDCCYFIKEGVADVTRADVAPGAYTRGVHPEHLATICEGRCFGEDALIQETRRNATVTMQTDGVLLVLDKHRFLGLLKEPVVDEITPQTLQSSGHQCIFLDVRTEAEYNLGHLAESVNVPLHLLHLKQRLLDPSKCYIAYCNSGLRSRVVCHFLREMGYEVVSLQGGIASLEREYKQQHWSRRDYFLKNGQVMEGH
ncbi:cyclic nucleotide-binding domain-containing protein [Aestuariicella hydrocarbonica]|uniref:Cyclic nucleotide-binding domain-containing protein n=1 Tax=Pseudomaricurvus hydrocarbonicus TaxID=1470433 RepID=A0A9E5JRB5_9GAMM|nr:cyclic nucleotide-binding domain-containing protein [Aestuariicella hydrocarbonica]NHO65322.1 cyclic nucleotide-binding domain-containing protein [Aestuariicella hydrocarbonica]